jgi:hypothetical protein
MFFVLKFELILIIGSNNVLTEGAALDRAGLDNRLTDGGKVVSPTITILDIFHRPVFYLKLH